jgi:hypothetical protein
MLNKNTYDVYMPVSTRNTISYCMIDVAVNAQRAHELRNFRTLVLHGSPAPDTIIFGVHYTHPFNPKVAAMVVAHKLREERVAEIVGDLTGFTARQRKRRRQMARKSLIDQGL